MWCILLEACRLDVASDVRVQFGVLVEICILWFVIGLMFPDMCGNSLCSPRCGHGPGPVYGKGLYTGRAYKSICSMCRCMTVITVPVRCHNPCSPPFPDSRASTRLTMCDLKSSIVPPWSPVWPVQLCHCLKTACGPLLGPEVPPVSVHLQASAVPSRDWLGSFIGVLLC